MTDTEIAQAVRTAADVLNKAILAAEAAGVRVELYAQSRDEMALRTFEESPTAAKYVTKSASVHVVITRAL